MLPLRSKAHIQKKNKSKRKILIMLLLTIVLILACFFYYAFAAQFHVQQINVSGTSFIRKENVEASVNSMLKTTLWGFVPRMSPLLIGDKLIESSLYQLYPSIDHVEVEIYNNTLFVDIIERKAVSVICSRVSLCYYLDIKGVAFAPAPTFEGSAFLKISTFEEDLAVGTILVSGSELENIIRLIEVFVAQGITIQHVSFESVEQMNVVATGDTAFIVRRKDDVEDVQDRLAALLSSRPEVRNGGYEYIDLRIDSKIFLKNKES